nr:unnamed protein product [Callosobruchus analis]
MLTSLKLGSMNRGICQDHEIASNISKPLQNRLQSELNVNIMNCPTHNIGVNLCQCKQVNKIANGTDTKFIRYLSRSPVKYTIDPVKLQAY